MKNFRVLFAVCVLAVSISFAQTQQSSTDKPETSQKAQTKKNSSADAKAKTNAEPSGTHSVMDHPLDEKADTIVVPAGTEIRVDMVEGKVTVPVRIGFSTPIPALSKASVKVDRVYAPAAYDAYGHVVNNARYAEYGSLTRVTVNGVTYEVESDSVALATPGSGAVSPDNTMGNSPHDVKFVLSAPLEIPR